MNNEETTHNHTDEKAIADEEIFDQVIVSTHQAIANLGETFGRYQGNADAWPKLVAHLHWYGIQLSLHAERLGARLSEHAERYPELATPPGGPCVLLLSDEEHAQAWNSANASTDNDEGVATASAYAAAVSTTYGRPELDQYAVTLNGSNGIAVVFHLAGKRDSVVRLLVGGIDIEDDEQSKDLNDFLAHVGIKAGPPVFFPPAMPERTFYSLGSEEALYDAYGRHARATGEASDRAL